jgi:hypothetical protein
VTNLALAQACKAYVTAIDSISYDYCTQVSQSRVLRGEEREAGWGNDSGVKETDAEEEESRSKVVQARLRQEGAADEVMIRAVQLLSRQCVYCEVTQEQGAKALEAAEAHRYCECEVASAGCQYKDFRAWRTRLQLLEYLHCWFCGLP